MNRYTFNKKWGKYGYEYYTVKFNNRIMGILRNTIYCCTICRDMTPNECDEYLTKNRFELELDLMRQSAIGKIDDVQERPYPFEYI